MSLKALLTGELTLSLRVRSALLQRTYATARDTKEEFLDLTLVDKDPKYTDELDLDQQQHLENIRNKSRLSINDYNVQHGRRPYENDGPAVHHYSLQWKRKMLGRYGIEGSGVPPGVAWPTKEMVAEVKEYEKVAYPLSVQDSWAQIAAEKAAREERVKAREDDIASKLAMTGQWEKDLMRKIAKKEADLQAAKQQKERIIEEVRRHFGFKVDPRDERFKQMLEQKEKEDKKRRKEARKKERSARILAQLLSGSNEAPQDATTADSSKSPANKDLS